MRMLSALTSGWWYTWLLCGDRGGWGGFKLTSTRPGLPSSPGRGMDCSLFISNVMQILDVPSDEHPPSSGEGCRSVVRLPRGMLSSLLMPGLRKQFHEARADARLGKS